MNAFSVALSPFIVATMAVSIGCGNTPGADAAPRPAVEADALATKPCPPGFSRQCSPDGIGGKLLCSCEPDDPTVPPPPPPVTTYTANEVVVGGGQVCALVRDPDALGSVGNLSVRCWGPRTLGTKVRFRQGVKHLAFGGSGGALCMIKLDDTIECTASLDNLPGLNSNAEIATRSDSSNGTSDPNLVDVNDVVTNGFDGCALVKGNSVTRCWGAGDFAGSLRVSGVTNSTGAPIAVHGNTGQSDLCGLATTQAFCFGNGDYRGRGVVSVPGLPFPSVLSYIVAAAMVPGGGGSAFCANGGVDGLCWGRSSSGRSFSYSIPVSNLRQIATGARPIFNSARTRTQSTQWECALDGAGAVACWDECSFGANDFATCWADLPTPIPPTPTIEPGVPSGIRVVAIGSGDIFAIAGGSLYAWGSDGSVLAGGSKLAPIAFGP